MGTKTDLDDIRNVSVTKQTEKYFAVGIIGSFGSAVAVSYILQHLGVDFLTLLIFFGFAMTIPITWGMSRSRTKLNMMHLGYDVDWSIDFDLTKPIGVDEYTIVRVDTGLGFGALGGHSTSPFVTSKRKLHSRARQQRRDATCSICREKPFDQRMIDRNGAYFIESRRRYWFCFIPISTEIKQTECRCAEHRPSELLD